MAHYGKRQGAKNRRVPSLFHPPSTPLPSRNLDVYNTCGFAPCTRVYWQRFACSR